MWGLVKRERRAASSGLDFWKAKRGDETAPHPGPLPYAGVPRPPQRARKPTSSLWVRFEGQDWRVWHRHTWSPDATPCFAPQPGFAGATRSLLPFKPRGAASRHPGRAHEKGRQRAIKAAIRTFCSLARFFPDIRCTQANLLPFNVKPNRKY